MNSTTLLQHFRLTLRDTEAPYLWADSEVLLYMDSAQKKWVREMGGIRDAVSPLTQIAVAADDTFVPYDKKILSITQAYRLSDKQEVSIVNAEDLSGNEATLTEAPGKIETLVVGMDASNLRLIPQALEAETLMLTVKRLPLLTIDDTGQELEIDEQYHEDLFLWMAHKAYLKQDAETFDKVKSDEFLARFMAAVRVAEGEFQKRHRRKRNVRWNGGI